MLMFAGEYPCRLRPLARAHRAGPLAADRAFARLAGLASLAAGG